MKQELILLRARNDAEVLYSTKDDDTSSVEISNVSWLVPYIWVNDKARIALLSIVEADTLISIPFRSWEFIENPALFATSRNNWTIKTSTQLEKPRYVLVCFQTSRKNSLKARNDMYDHIQLKDIKLFLNSECHPYANLNLDIEKKDISFLYEMYVNFLGSYYGRKSGGYQSALSRKEFLDSNFIVAIDCKYQNESIKSGSVDIRLEIETMTTVPQVTSCSCLIIHDQLIQYSPLSNMVKRW